MWHRRFVNKHGYVAIKKRKRTAKKKDNKIYGVFTFLQFSPDRPFSLGRFVFPLQTTCYSLKNCSFIHLKIIPSNTRDYLKI